MSAFQFGNDFAEYLARTGSTKGFAGETWAPYLWCDVDRDEAAGGIPQALNDVRLLVDTLVETFGVPREVLLPFLSGGKGFHLGVPTSLWAPPASADFHAIARAFIEGIATEAKVAVDVGVFDRVRAFRAPNSRHPKTGLHKLFVPVDRLDGITVDEVLGMARQPMPFEVPSAEGVESVDFLVAEWDKASRAIVDRAAAAEQRRRELAGGGVGGSVNALTRAFLAGDIGTGDRHRLLYSAAANLAEIGCSLPAVRALLTDPALDLGLPPKDVSRGIDNGFARADPFVASAAELFGGTVVRVLHPEPEGGEK